MKHFSGAPEKHSIHAAARSWATPDERSVPHWASSQAALVANLRSSGPRTLLAGNRRRRAPDKEGHTMAVTATFQPGSGVLTVFGDNLDNNAVVSRNAAGNILINGGAVNIIGGTPTVANTSL